ncbi:MAG: diguanylate cyclase [Deltaproteobacteria bacterium]|nr:diguanylate cyclase [Deltaproteobacteria bacterium]
MIPKLGVEVAGLTLKNPLMPGSGPPGDSLMKLKKLEDNRAGCLVTKTISTSAAPKTRPVMAFEKDLFFNTEKWSTKSLEEWKNNILPGLSERRIPLVASVGYTPKDLSIVIPELDGMVDAFEISTHYVGSDASSLLDAVRLASTLTDHPVFVKLSAHSTDIVASALAAEKGGASAITAINSVGPVISVDVAKGASRLGTDSPYAWLSGPAIKPIAMRAVYDISKAVDIPVVACGGITNASDILEFFMSGASAVQMCTALIRNGPKHISRVLKDLSNLLHEHGIERLDDIRGTLIPRYKGARDAPS